MSRFTGTTNTPMDNAMIYRYAPSVFADTAYGAMSGKYQFIPTISIVDAMRKDGFYVTSARQSRTRIEGKGNYTKHMIRFRRHEQVLAKGGVFPEVVLINSHDGSSSYRLFSGLFRLVCMNGLVCQLATHEDYHTRHTGNIQNQVIEASYRVVSDFPEITEKIHAWQSQYLTSYQQTDYAYAASLLRWDEDQARPEPASLLALRRHEDFAIQNTLWGTMNIVQEGLIRGRNFYRATDKRGRYIGRRRTRAVTGIDQDVKLNKALWALTEKMASLV